MHKRGIPLLADAPQIPPTFRYQKRSVREGIEGLCMLQKKIYDKFKPFTDLEKRKQEISDYRNSTTESNSLT